MCYNMLLQCIYLFEYGVEAIIWCGSHNVVFCICFAHSPKFQIHFPHFLYVQSLTPSFNSARINS